MSFVKLLGRSSVWLKQMILFLRMSSDGNGCAKISFKLVYDFYFKSMRYLI